MKVRFTRREFTIAGAALLTKPPLAFADDLEQGIPLTDDFSRGEIFKQFVVDPFEVDNDSATLAIPATFQFPRDVIYDCTVNDHHRCIADTTKLRGTDVMFGVDINHYTDADDFSFDQLREQRVRFVQMKTSQGSNYRDDKFPTFWKQAEELAGDRKIYRGPYHFLTASADGKVQADWFLKLLDKAGGLKSDDMAPGVDLEWDVYKSTGKLDHWKDKGAQFIIDTVMSFMQRVGERTGRTPVIYTGKSWFGPHTIPLNRFKEFEKYPLWVFDYDPGRKIAEKPLLPDKKLVAALWQFTSSARVPVCYNGSVDASVFYGKEDDFKKTFGMA